MFKVLVPVDSSANSELAIRHIVKEFNKNPAMEIHLLNVQPPFRRDVSQFVARKTLADYHRAESDKVLHRHMRTLDRHGIPYALHRAVGHQAECIAATAQRLRCDVIVMSTARKNALTRFLESSVTNRVLALTSVPVEIIPGIEMSPWERFGIPAALTALLAAAIAAAAD